MNQPDKASADSTVCCTCPSGDGSLRWPCPQHPPKVADELGAAPAPIIRTWRERIGAGPDFPLHAPTDVERAMEAEIAELRVRDEGLQADAACLVDEMRQLRQVVAGFVAGTRLAQQEATPADVLTVPKAIMDIKVDQSRSDEYKRGHRDARHAAADLVLEMADKLVALATPTIEQKGGA